MQLAKFYAEAIIASGVKFDMLFGPAYKGIILAAATAMMLAEKGVNVPFAYNRKEAKDHGEGGVLVGAPLKGRVLIIDDVISAGTSVRESVKLIEAEGATPAAVAIALDRMEKARANCRRCRKSKTIRPAGGFDCQLERLVHALAKQCRIWLLLRAGQSLSRTLRRGLNHNIMLRSSETLAKIYF